MRIARKLIPLENDPSDSKDEADNVVKDTIPCNALGCTQRFTSLLNYENHYRSAHQHTCLTCHRAFPSEHLLDVHIQENHDPLFAILAERQNMYQCLVESCGVKFPNPDDRRQHMIKVHCYPANFRFHRLKPTDPKHRKKPARPGKTANGMDVDKPSPPQGSQENAPEKTHTSSTPAASHTGASPTESPSDKENAATGAEGTQGADGKGEEEGMEVSEAEKPVPRRVFVHKVPQNFSFGHGVSRGFQRPPGKKKSKNKGAHWHQRAGDSLGETTTNIETVDMKDMVDALSDAL